MPSARLVLDSKPIQMARAIVLTALVTGIVGHSFGQARIGPPDRPESPESGPEITTPATRPTEAMTDADVAAASELYAGATALDEQGATTAAISAYNRALRRYPFAPDASTAQYRVAELLESQGNLSRAFDAYQNLLTRYPDTQNFERAVAAQVAIANKYLAGKPQTFFGIPIGNSAKRAQEMYQGILTNAPFSRYAPVVQFNLGLAYEKQSLPYEAIAAYQRVLDNYPNSDVVDDALYQIGFVYMRIGFADQSQDLSALTAAQNTFEDFLIEFPESEKVAQARENLTLLDTRESSDILAIAEFYEFHRDPRAAAIYYSDVIRRQPNSEEAQLAKSKLEELRGKYGEDAVRPGPENAETGEKVALRRRLQRQVETSALADYAGPPTREIVPDELPVGPPQMRTSIEDVRPLPAAVEPDLPIE